jgi:hypothetical protein
MADRQIQPPVARIHCVAFVPRLEPKSTEMLICRRSIAVWTLHASMSRLPALGHHNLNRPHLGPIGMNPTFPKCPICLDIPKIGRVYRDCRILNLNKCSPKFISISGQSLPKVHQILTVLSASIVSLA